MRSIINISLTQSLNQIVTDAVSSGRYSSKSEFFRCLLRKWIDGQLVGELKQSEEEMKAGKGKLLKSLKDLR